MTTTEENQTLRQIVDLLEVNLVQEVLPQLDRLEEKVDRLEGKVDQMQETLDVIKRRLGI